jgi:hypothetical protein
MGKVSMPTWVAICLVASTVASLVFAASALTSYMLVKPYVLTISTGSAPFDVEAINFNYDPASNRYESCQVTVKNLGSNALTAAVSVYLRNATQSIVASGQYSGSFSPGSTPITIALAWTSGAAVNDVANGWTVITQ